MYVDDAVFFILTKNIQEAASINISDDLHAYMYAWHHTALFVLFFLICLYLSVSSSAKPLIHQSHLTSLHLASPIPAERLQDQHCWLNTYRHCFSKRAEEEKS